jgi:hypothetical protein
MEQENKDLLLKYLCMALPYDLQVKTEGDDEPYFLLSVQPYKGIALILIGINMSGVYATSKVKIDTVKPYLRPMSSMTLEEEREYNLTKTLSIVDYPTLESFDWLIAHHFDYRGLIDKGLAIEVTEENNPYK